MKTIVIYHKSDWDGIFCREIARKFVPNAELIGWDYGDTEPVVSEDEQFYILDLSVPGLMNHPGLIWIDHHKSAIEKFDPKTSGYRIDGVAACRLAWQWFNHWKEERHDSESLPEYQDYVDRTVNEPLAVRLAGEYDIWDKRDPRAELFQHGLRSQTIGGGVWRGLLHYKHPETLDAILERGEIVKFVRDNEYAEVIKEQGFDIQFEGLTFLACCSHELDIRSQLFAAGVKPHHDALFGFTYTGTNWRVSLYHAPGKEHHDLSQIAVKYGGGGHRGACGFKVDKLPFL